MPRRIHRGPDRGSGITGAATLGGVPAVPGPVPFGIYVHVPFCAARCGYCDFNTYTPSELAGSGASPDGWLDAVRRELARARAAVGARAVDTVCRLSGDEFTVVMENAGTATAPSLTVAGPAVEAAQRLRAAAATNGMRMVVSAEVRRQGGP